MNHHYKIGQCPVVLVYKQTSPPQAVITTVIAEHREASWRPSIQYIDSTIFSEKTQDQIKTVLLRMIHRMGELLQVPVGSFELSLSNISATSAKGTKILLHDNSADLPIFFALLSAWLHLPLNQEVVMTGHIASVDGQVRMVQSLAEKMDACFREKKDRHFICPSLKSDTTLSTLTPLTYENLEHTILKTKLKHRVTQAMSIADALPHLVADEQVVLGSLRRDYFDRSPVSSDFLTPTSKCARFLMHDIQKRFFDVLHEAFMNGDQDRVKTLLEERIDFQVRRNRYPAGLGLQLQNIMLSLPANILQFKISFPLLSSRIISELSKYVIQEKEQQDFFMLLEAVHHFPTAHSVGENHKPESDSSRESYDSLVEFMMEELDESNLYRKFGQSINQARISFTSDQITVENEDEFFQLIQAFYTHLMNQVHPIQTASVPHRMDQEALLLLEKAFQQSGGSQQAYREATKGTEGGMRLIYDLLTNYYKLERYEIYKKSVFTQVIDSNNWNQHKLLAQAIQRKLDILLPAEMRTLSAEELAHNWETAIRVALENKKKLNHLAISMH